MIDLRADGTTSIGGTGNHVSGRYEGDVTIGGDTNVLNVRVAGNLIVAAGANSNVLHGFVGRDLAVTGTSTGYR